MPCGEAFFERDTMTCGVHLMSGQRKVLADRTEPGEKSLRAFGVAKAAHLAFAPAGRLMTVFGAVVHAGSRFDEDVLHMGEFRNVGLRRRIAAQLIGNDPARHRA